MEQKLNIACTVFAGGASKRFGEDKGMALLHGQPLLAHVIDSLREQTFGPIAVNARPESAYAAFGDTCVPDVRKGGLGPLAGLHAALSWAASIKMDQVATCALDTPFLPEDLLVRLSAQTGPVIASSNGRLHPVCGIWPVTLLPTLGKALDDGMRAAHAWAELCNAEHISFGQVDGHDPFFNINTLEDMEQAARV